MPADGASGTLVDLRVHAANPDVQGVVVRDEGGDWVRVLWDDGEEGRARRDLLYLVGEWEDR